MTTLNNKEINLSRTLYSVTCGLDDSNENIRLVSSVRNPTKYPANKIGADLKKFKKILEGNVEFVNIGSYMFEERDDVTDLSKRILVTNKPKLISPYVEDISCGDPVKFFSNVDFLFLPSEFKGDYSGEYTLSSGAVVYVQKIGLTDGYGTVSEIKSDGKNDLKSENMYKKVEKTLKTIRKSLFSQLDILKVFMLDPEWEDRDSFSTDSLPYAMTFSMKEGVLHACIPSFGSYFQAMLEEPMYMAYYKTKDSLSEFFGIKKEKINISLNFLFELHGFKVSDDVWVESLIDDITPIDDLSLNRFWFGSDEMKALEVIEHTVDSVADWLLREGTTCISYFSYLEHDAGAEVAYTISAFKGRQRLLYFTVSAFDSEKGHLWMSALKKKLSIPFVCSDEKEDNWDLITLDEDSWPNYTMPEAPLFPKECFSVIGLYLVLDGDLPVTPPRIISLQEVPELLSLGVNAPLEFTGSLSSPFYVKTKDFISPLLMSKNIINEALEDGLNISDNQLAEKLTFEFHSRLGDRQDLCILSLVVLNTSESHMTDYVFSGDFPAGEMDSPKLLAKLNQCNPGIRIKKLFMVPFIQSAMG